MAAHRAVSAVAAGELDSLAAVSAGDQPGPAQHLADLDVIEFAVLRRERVDRRRDHPYQVGGQPVRDVTLP